MRANRNWSEQDLEEAKLRMMGRSAGTMTAVRGGVGGGAIERDSPQRMKSGVSQGRSTVPMRNSREPVTNPVPSLYRSKLEQAWANKLDLELKAGLILAWWYEPFSLWLPGGVRYKPDFLVQRRDPQYVVSIDCTTPNILEVIEVKGWSKNRRDGMTRLKVAAALFPCFAWTLVTRDKGAWIERRIEGGA